MRWLLWTVFLLVAATGVAAFFFVPAPALLWMVAAVTLVLILLLVLNHRIIKPLRAVATGVSLLNEQDFSSRLASVGQRDADMIGATFNRMINELKNERLRVMEQNHFLDMLIAASPAGIIILNFDSTVKSANPAARQMLGVGTPEGLHLRDMSSDLGRGIASLADGRTVTLRLGDTRIYRCTRRTFIDGGFQRPFILIESLADEIMKAERSAYGKVIRMIGHEVNNTVAGLLPLFETVEMISPDPALTEAAASCRERCDSLGSFISRYAEVVKLPSPTLMPARLNRLVEGLMPFLESMAAGRDIALRFEGSEAQSMLDTVMIGQVVVNIVKNSIESIGSGGEISIRVTDAPVRLTVTDNGPGLSDEAAGNLFSPFFSTKEGGQGIGLTVVREILREHGCTFSLRTDRSTGLTVFSVQFP